MTTKTYPSRSHPDAVHVVTDAETMFPKCDCTGFGYRGSCSHTKQALEEQVQAEGGEMTTALTTTAKPPSVALQVVNARTQLAAVRGGIDDARQIAVALRGMWPGDLKGKYNNPATKDEAESAAVMQVYMAAELGISPMMAFQYLYVVEGRPFISAKAVDAIIQTRVPGAWIEVTEQSATKVTGRAHRPGRNSLELTLTIEECKPKSVKEGSAWAVWPRPMLVNRLKTNLGWLMFADVLTGMGGIYVEEAQDSTAVEPIDNRKYKVIAGEPAPPLPPAEGPLFPDGIDDEPADFREVIAEQPTEAASGSDQSEAGAATPEAETAGDTPPDDDTWSMTPMPPDDVIAEQAKAMALFVAKKVDQKSGGPLAAKAVESQAKAPTGILADVVAFIKGYVDYQDGMAAFETKLYEAAGIPKEGA